MAAPARQEAAGAGALSVPPRSALRRCDLWKPEVKALLDAHLGQARPAHPVPVSSPCLGIASHTLAMDGLEFKDRIVNGYDIEDRCPNNMLRSCLE